MAGPGAATTEAALLSEKCKRFGVLGAGIISDSLITLRLAEVRQEAPSVTAATIEKVRSALNSPQSAVPPPVYAGKKGPATASVNGKSLTRDQILAILTETVRVQGIVQQEVSVLARKLAKESKKKKRGKLTFLDGHKKILELQLPKEPLDDHGLTENAFQKLLLQYEEDEEVMACAQKLLHPAGKGDPERAAGINMDKIIEIHKFMVQEMQKVLQEFMELPQETRRSFTGKGCETTAELLVSIAVEQHLSVRCEDVEQAVIRYEESLQAHPEFTRYTEQLASMMQHLIGAAQPRVQKAEFLRLLRHMGDSTKKAKAFAKKLYEDYRSKSCNICEAYRRFDAFNEEGAQAAAAAEELPDLSSVELQLCYDEYRSDEEVRRIWEQSGVETNLMLQNAFPMMSGSSRASCSSPSGEDSKRKKLKSSEVVEMQELMVDEMKRSTEAARQAISSGKEPPWKAEITIQMIQALASAAVERRYGISAEEMTLAGFQHATALQQNQRLARASEEQQEILMTLARLCGQDT